MENLDLVEFRWNFTQNVDISIHGKSKSMENKNRKVEALLQINEAKKRRRNVRRCERETYKST